MAMVFVGAHPVGDFTRITTSAIAHRVDSHNNPIAHGVGSYNKPISHGGPTGKVRCFASGHVCFK